MKFLDFEREKSAREDLAEENRIQSITTGESYPMLLQQVYRPADRMAMVRTLTLLDLLSRKVKLYRLECNMELEAADFSYRVMSKSLFSEEIRM